jgi:hypothetical protein
MISFLLEILRDPKKRRKVFIGLVFVIGVRARAEMKGGSGYQQSIKVPRAISEGLALLRKGLNAPGFEGKKNGSEIKKEAKAVTYCDHIS